MNPYLDAGLGARVLEDRVRFRVFSSAAERVVLDLREGQKQGLLTQQIEMEPVGQGIWQVEVSDCAPGQRYGYRTHGPWDPDRGIRCNPAKLLLDPYARRVVGGFHWTAAVFDYRLEAAQEGWVRDERDSAPFVPNSVVCASDPEVINTARIHQWCQSVVYECNVRGFTMRHPSLSDAERGRFAGLSNGAILDHLKALGITTIQLQPVQGWIDEHHLAKQGLRNYWGYNTVSFFAPDPRLSGPDPVAEFRAMVAALHEAGFEVMLDVAYNHTGEGDALGPSLSFRGLDQHAYYRLEASDPGLLVNHTGTGNTMNTDHPVVQALVVESLRYWHQVMGVDGFRFDLATILGRTAQGFTQDHPLLELIDTDHHLRDAQMIAEPWDPGPGGYQLGGFTGRWSEWNDQYRDTVRRFWRGDARTLAELARRVHGSADLFDKPGRGPCSSVNFITAHDGFTLMDLVSYERRHNEANGEENRDGHAHNISNNHGVEGPTDHRVVRAMRYRHRLNLIATLFFSQGVPMLLGGDELGHTQQGNNNAYAQDNDLAWIDWSLLQSEASFLGEVKRLIELRKQLPLLRQPDYLHGHHATGSQGRDIDWYHPEGRPMEEGDWSQDFAVLKLLSAPVTHRKEVQDQRKIAVAFNAYDREIDFRLPELGRWSLEYATDGSTPTRLAGEVFRAAAWSVSLLVAGVASD